MKRIIIISIIFALPLLISSCGIYKPYLRPETKTDKLFGETVETTDTTTIASLKWEQVFTDSDLQRLIRNGLGNNVDLRIAHLRITQAETSLKSARLSYFPAVSFNPQGNLNSFDGSDVAKTYQLPVAASWELDIFGKVTNVKHQKKAALEQSKAYQQTVRTQLIANIANSYYTLLMLDKQLEITLQTSVLWEKNVNVMRALKQAGQTTEAAIAQADANKRSADASVINLRRQITEVENALCVTLGETPRAIERGKFEEQVLPETLSIGIPLQLLSNRPDVQSAEAALMQAYYATNEARSYFYPSITLSGNIGWTNSGGGGISNPGAILWQVIGNLSQPIFNKGVNKARLDMAKVQQEEAKLNFQQTLLNAGSEVNNALAQCQSTKEKVSLYDQQVTLLKSAVHNTQLLMQHGNTTSYLEVLTSQQTLLQAQLNQISNRFDAIQGVITLYRALGGGRN
ncbi:TolC family protein [Culturomica sp.]|uniref:TolC family protein n=1 Tax=Culturomica sp. TaxID=1926652 RepID=UPI000E7F90AB|nr:TolC family protein [Culturomica sp.]HBO26275.1 multidrug transporter [Culturomica sp.]